MTDYEAIPGASRTLAALLENHITNDPALPLNSVPIELRSPRVLREEGTRLCVSVWLYRINRNPDRANEPPEPIDGGRVPRFSIPLDLHYLITAMAANVETEQALLGRVIQVFNDHAHLKGPALKGALAGGRDELRLILEMLSLEDMSRVWSALEESYHLSVPYIAQLVTVDSGHAPVRHPRVLRRDAAPYAQVLGGSA